MVQLVESCVPKTLGFGQPLNKDGGATDSVSVALPRDEVGVHLMLANLPGVSYESASRRFRETRSTILD